MFCSNCHDEISDDERYCKKRRCRKKDQKCVNLYVFPLILESNNFMKVHIYNYVYVRLVHYILYSQVTGMNPFKGKHRLKFFLDVQDGKIMNSHVYGGFLTRPEHLALMLNTDGVQKFKSSSLNIWPVYLAITFGHCI